MLIGTTKVPNIPANICTGIAPTTSSIFLLSKNFVPKYIINDPIAPITIANTGLGVKGSAVIATNPANAPFNIITISVFPPSNLVTTAAADQQARCKPIYEEISGWDESTEGARSWADLPANAIKYVRRIEELIDCPVALVSTSPERNDTILVTDPFED